MSVTKNIIFNNELTNFDDEDFGNTNAFDSHTSTVHLSIKKLGKKHSTVISGLGFESKEKLDGFLKHIKKKFGINGCYKLNEEIDANEKVFIFSGDCREKVKEYLINEMGVEEENVRMHG
jgi:translation initiation factor 1 (eIF-1/SUI1)